MANYKFKDEDVRQHLMMCQDIINRMAANSSNCKNWMITIIAALTALQITQNQISEFGWLMIVVEFMFWGLDAFYLALERIHRRKEADFVTSLNDENYENKISKTIYTFSTKDKECKLKLTWNAMWSSSCWPFYLTIIVISVWFSWGNPICLIFKCFCHGS